MKLVVNEGGERLDKFIVNNTDLSRSIVSKIFLNAVLVNGNSAKASYKVKTNDVIEFDENVNEEINLEPIKMDLKIVFEDEHLIIIDKPSGLVVHPGSGNKSNTLVNGLLYHTSELSDLNTEERPGIVHRLDKDTSGLMVVAKTNEAHAILSELFKEHKIKRVYTALLNGIFPNNSATIDAPIGRDSINRKKMAVTATNSKKAVTNVYVVKRYKAHTLANFILETGRTHQIRVHAAYVGFPVYNDPVYANKSKGEFGQFLHSSEIEFIHPITNELLKFNSELPKEFSLYLEELDSEM